MQLLNVRASMMSVLQLFDVSPDFQTGTLAAQLREGLGSSFNVDRFELRRNGPALFRGLVSARNRSAEVIHAFGVRALLPAIGSRSKVVFSPVEFPTRSLIRWLRAAMDHRDIHVACPTDTMRRRFVERGVPIDCCHLIRPAVSFAEIKRKRDDALRRQLGFAPDDCVVLAPGESVRSAAHERAAWTMAILNVLDPRYRMLIWGRGPRADQVLRYSRRVATKSFMVSAEPTLRRSIGPGELFCVSDTVLVTPDAPCPVLPICMSMAAGLPIVSTVTPTLAELLEDRHTCLFSRSSAPRVIAKRLLDLDDDPHVRWRIADMARTEAYEYFSASRLLDQYRTLFTQLASGTKVEVAQPAPGAGLRFHGRA